MGVDYMTRWVEAAPIRRIIAKDMGKFIFDNICCRFGTPLEIISNRGPVFGGELVEELMKRLKIKQRHSMPYYPHCNALVEKVNGMICKIITKHVGDKPQTWDWHLNAVLWAYRTSFKVALGFTPFQLVSGQEALLPIEVELASLRVRQQQHHESHKKLIRKRILELEKLQLKREDAIKHYAHQAKKRRDKFNQKLTKKDIEEGSIVLSYDSMFDNRKDSKFVPHWEGPLKVMQ